MTKANGSAAGAKDLETIFPGSKQVQVGEETIDVRPLKVRQIAKIAKAAREIATSNIDLKDLASVVTEYPDEIITIVAAAIDRDETWVGELTADHLIVLMREIVAVNTDFFTRRVVPELSAALETISAAQADGPTRLNS